MTDIDDLKGMIAELAAMKLRFIRGSSELYLGTEDQARFAALQAEARAILDDYNVLNYVKPISVQSFY